MHPKPEHGKERRQKSTDKKAALRAFQEAVLKLDKNKCRNPRCSSDPHWKKVVHAHHIVYRSHGGANDPTNGITLCVECHNLVHKRKAEMVVILESLLRSEVKFRWGVALSLLLKS